MIFLEIGEIFGFLTHFPFPLLISREKLFFNTIVPVIIYGHSDLIAIKILKKKILTKNSRPRPSPEKGVPGRVQGQKLNFLKCPSRVIIFRKVTKFGGNRPKTKKVINRQTKFTWKTPPPSANRVKENLDQERAERGFYLPGKTWNNFFCYP